MRLALFAVLLMFLPGSSVQSQDADSGVPLSLAEERAARVSNLRYELRLDVPAVQSAPVTGEVVIRFDLKDGSRPLAIDFAAPEGSLGDVTIAGRKIDARWTNEHVLINAAHLKPGANEITLRFKSSDGPLNRNPEFLYALFVPARARQTFPCFDQPDLKARYSLTMVVPNAWEALSNAPETRRTPAGAETTIQFEETRPISTYLFTFAAGRFKVETAQRSGRTFRMLHR
jgi:aminopeptidase N